MHREPGTWATVRAVVHIDAATVGTGDLPTQIQTEADSARIAGTGVVESCEGIEDRAAVLDGDSRPLVLDLDQKIVELAHTAK